MNPYRSYVLPRLVHLACSGEPTRRQRQRLVPRARGDVLEVGIGSGLNLPYYDPVEVTKVWGLDPAPEMAGMASKAMEQAPFDVEWVSAPGEEIPLESGRFDTVVMTYTLCTISDSERALREVARVLKPGGRLLFCEHGVAPDERVRRWQHRLNPVWRRLSGGCQLNRDIPALLRQGGFEITGMETTYVPLWRPASFNYWGTAIAR